MFIFIVGTWSYNQATQAPYSIHLAEKEGFFLLNATFTSICDHSECTWILYNLLKGTFYHAKTRFFKWAHCT